MSDSVRPHRRQPTGSPVPGILQARTLEWGAISFSNAWKGKVKAKSLSRVRLLVTPWTAAYQAPPSMGFSRQEYWSGVPSPSPINRYLGCYKVDIFLSYLLIPLFFPPTPKTLHLATTNLVSVFLSLKSVTTFVFVRKHPWAYTMKIYVIIYLLQWRWIIHLFPSLFYILPPVLIGVR